jgi:hypothetical protein
VLPIALAIATCASLGAGASHAQSYLPLATGNRWTYQSVNGLHEEHVISGTTTIQGRTVYVKSYLESTYNTGLENYWSEGPDGDLLLSGAYRSVEGWGWIFDPPLLFLDAPLVLGKPWTTRSTIYYLPDTSWGGPIEVTFAVFEDTTLVVPAGKFRAFGTGQSPMLAMAATTPNPSLSVDGAFRASSGAPSDWFAAGVGVVQFDSDDRYQLAEHELPTPVVATSWGRLKRLYR